MQVEQESLDQVSCWCDNNSMAINPNKTHSMTVTTRQKRQLLPLSLDLLLQVTGSGSWTSGSTPTLRNNYWQQTLVGYTYSHCAKHLLSMFSFYLKYVVDTDTLKLFFNAHIKSLTDYSSVVWGGCSDALKNRLNSLFRRSGKLIFPDKNLTTDQKLNKIGTMILHKWLDYKGVFMYRALTNSAPVYISSWYKAPHSSSRNNYLQLPKPRIDLFKTSITISWALFQCTSDHVTQLQAKPLWTP